MLERFITCEEEVAMALKKLKISYQIDEIEVNCIKKILEILSPFEYITKLI
jgi:hypothetical protein